MGKNMFLYNKCEVKEPGSMMYADVPGIRVCVHLMKLENDFLEN
ncbi:hypothetical protein [Lacrimispora sp.]|nr:hypothetical protein [Lacrimispora sp.]